MFLIAKIVRGRRLLHELEKQAEKEEKAREVREREREKERMAIEKANNSPEWDPNEATGAGSESPRAGASVVERVKNREHWRRQFSLVAVKDAQLEESNLAALAASTPAVATDGLRRRRRTWTPDLRRSVEPRIRVKRSPSPHSHRTSNPAVQRRPSMSIVTTPLLAMARSFRVKRATTSSSSGQQRLRMSRVEVNQLRRRYMVGSAGLPTRVETIGLTSSRTTRQDVDGFPLREGTDELLDLPDRSSRRRSTSAVLRRTSSMPSVTLDIAGERLRHYNYDIKLNRLQKRALRFTWHRLHTRNGGKKVEQVFEDVYDRLLKSIPICSQMFATRIFISAMSKVEAMATLRDHARLTVKMFDMIIRNLDCEDRKRMDTGSEFDPLRIGRAHVALRPYGFVSAFWEKLGETIIDVVLGQEAVRDLPGASQAWVVLTACVVDQLRAGFENARNVTQQRAPPAPSSQTPKKPSTATNPQASPRVSTHEQQPSQQTRPSPSMGHDRQSSSTSSNESSQNRPCPAGGDGENDKNDKDGAGSSRKCSYTHAKCSNNWSAPLVRLATQESWSSSRHSGSRRSTPENLPAFAEESK